jgi:hypothetical protein
VVERGELRTDLPGDLLRRGMWLLSGRTTAFAAINAGLTSDLYRIWLSELVNMSVVEQRYRAPAESVACCLPTEDSGWTSTGTT